MFFAVLLSWIAAGLVVGFIASKAVNLRGDDSRLGIFASVVGALVGGIVYSLASDAGFTTWTVWGLAWACIGAVIGVVLWHLIRSRYITTERYTTRRSY